MTAPHFAKGDRVEHKLKFPVAGKIDDTPDQGRFGHEYHIKFDNGAEAWIPEVDLRAATVKAEPPAAAASPAPRARGRRGAR